ncbi:MAG: hypothetical protein LBE61_09565 [Burkholderiaceae bacterium]|jgi:hypothetical protein|nr:hypothetical protein [Burkholderiaceae bacterium]
MANQWLRLWHDMPTDPKWRTIARHAKQHISLVQAVYLHILVDASRNVTRGHVDVTTEDLASALDCDESQIQSILDAMQGRVLDGDAISGWDKRQPRREDAGDAETGAKSSAQRKKEQREREKAAAESADFLGCHAESRNVTTDKDKDTEEIEEANASLSAAKLPDCPHVELIDLFGQHLPTLPQPKPELWDGQRAKNLAARWRWVLTAKRRSGERYATDKDSALDFFSRFFGFVGICPHLVGENDRGWTADLAWLAKADNFAKVMAGNYDTRKQLETA